MAEPVARHQTHRCEAQDIYAQMCMHAIELWPACQCAQRCPLASYAHTDVQTGKYTHTRWCSQLLELLAASFCYH